MAGLAGKVTVGLVLNAPVTLIPVFSTTGVSPEDGPLVVGVELADDGWLDEGLDPADGEREPDEHALTEITAAASSASSVGLPRHRVRATLPIESHSVVGPAAEPNRPTPPRLRGGSPRGEGESRETREHDHQIEEPLDRTHLVRFAASLSTSVLEPLHAAAPAGANYRETAPFGSRSDRKRSSILSKLSSWPSDLVMWSRPRLSSERQLQRHLRHSVSLVQIHRLDGVRIRPPFEQPRLDGPGRRLDLQVGSPK